MISIGYNLNDVVLDINKYGEERFYWWHGRCLTVLITVYLVVLRHNPGIRISVVWFTRDTGEPPTPDEIYYNEVKDWERFDCYPESESTEELCKARGCFWKAVDEDKLAPTCFYPPTFGYQLLRGIEGTELGWSAKISRLEGLPSRYGMDIKKLHVDMEMQTGRRVHFKVMVHLPYREIFGQNNVTQRQ